MIRFTRTSLFFSGLAIILLSYVGYKLVVILMCNKTSGLVVNYETVQSETTRGYKLESFYPVIQYVVNGDTFTTRGEENVQLVVGQIIPLLYKRSDPTKAFVNTFWAYWFHPIIILPIIVLGALIIGIGKNGSYWTLYFRKPRVTRIELQKRNDI